MFFCFKKQFLIYILLHLSNKILFPVPEPHLPVEQPEEHAMESDNAEPQEPAGDLQETDHSEAADISDEALAPPQVAPQPLFQMANKPDNDLSDYDSGVESEFSDTEDDVFRRLSSY